jgi:hypothetical protein
MRASSLLVVAVLVTAAAACDENAATTEEPTFEAVVEQVITPKCTFSQCHANPTIAAGLDLTPERACETLVNKSSCLFPERMRIVPGHPEESFFFHKLTGQGLDETPTGNCGSDSAASVRTNLLMPFGASELSDEEIQLVHGWIAAGASCTPGTPTPPMNRGPAIASITADRTTPLAGQSVMITVALDKPAPEGGQTITLEMDTSALTAPVQMVVPAKAASMRFEAYALRPTSRFTIRARAGESSKDLVLRIAGLDIAEVLADPSGDDDQLQWIKLHNRSSLPIDLNGYRLQVGQDNYGRLAVNLTGTVPAGGCAVIGGPTQSGANSEPIFSQLINFTPDLPHGGTQAAGFAVFDGAASLVAGVQTPVDTMLVGASNDAMLLGPDGEIPSPHCATPVAGTSALRTAAGTCVQAQMQPRTCP